MIDVKQPQICNLLTNYTCANLQDLLVLMETLDQLDLLVPPALRVTLDLLVL